MIVDADEIVASLLGSLVDAGEFVLGPGKNLPDYPSEGLALLPLLQQLLGPPLDEGQKVNSLTSQSLPPRQFDAAVESCQHFTSRGIVVDPFL